MVAEKGKGGFIKVYANLPVNIREEIIVTVDDHPYTWNSAYDEISNETELGKKILKKVIELGLI